MLEIVTGDDELIPVTLKKNGATFMISPSATVKAAIIDDSHSRIIAGPVTLNSATAGSNWAASLVIVSLSGDDTVKLKKQSAKLEIQVNDGGRKTWHIPCELKKGLIE